MKTVAVLIAACSTAVLAATPTWTFTPAATPADGGAGTIASSDGNWTLRVRIVKASSKTLSLGQYLDSESSKTGGGTAKVSGSGDLDLRGAVTRAGTSEAWTIIHLAYGSLGRGESTGFTDRASFYAPTTLQSMHQCFYCTSDDYHQSFTNVVVEAKNFTTLSSDKIFILGSGVDTNLCRLVFKTPNLTSVRDNGFSVYWANPDNAQQLKLWGSSFDEWDLTGVESIGNNAFFGRHIAGTLNLPKIKTIGYGAFTQITNLTKVSLSPELKQLKRVGAEAFRQNQWGSNRYVSDSTVKEVELGGAFGFTIMTNAFNGQQSLRSVSFTGAKPVYDIQANGIVFGSGQAAKTMAFYVPDNAEWADVLAAATPATAAERAAWSSAHPDYLPIWGVVPASVFHTKNDQYIGYYSPRVKKPELFFDARFGDGATFESLGPYPAAADGSWPTNNAFRITAMVGTGGTFTRWYGDMPKDLCSQQTIEVTGDRLLDMRWLLPRITRPWTLDTANNLITNRFWKLHVYVSSGTRLVLGNYVGGWEEVGRALTETGGGYLDLGGPITDAGGKTYVLTGVQGGNSSLGATATKPGPTVFVSPGTFTGSFMNYRTFNSASKSDSALQVLVIDEPNVTSGFTANGWALGGTKIEYLQVRVPKLASIGENFFNQWDNVRTEMNFSTFDFASVTNVGRQAFYFCRQARGAVDLPKLKILGESAFYGCWNLEAAYLATNKHEGVRSVSSSSLRNCLAFKKLVLNIEPDCTWSDYALYDCDGLREIQFLGVPPTSACLANMLKLLPETTGAKSCTVYGSPYQEKSGRIWAALASVPTAAEAATFTGEGLYGVHRKDAVGAPTKGTAWIVRRESPWDPKGMLLLVR